MIDLNHLDRYIVIQTSDTGLDAVDDVRELEGDFGTGVYPLWSDNEQSILAFAFDPGVFKQTEAEEWVKKSMEKPAAMGALDIVKAVVAQLAAPLTKALEAAQRPRADGDPVRARSFDETQSLVRRAVREKWPTTNDATGEVAQFEPWIIDMGPGQAIVELRSGDYDGNYTISYQIDNDGAVTLGDPEPVKKQWARDDGAPVMLHAFSVRLGPGDEAAGDDDGVIWKELIHPGRWFKTDSGRAVEITADMIDEVYRAFEAGVPKMVSVPSDSHHDARSGVVPAENNRGFVFELKKVGTRLFGGFGKLSPAVEAGIEDGSIADVSVYLQPNVVHPETGEVFKWVLRHVLLTNDPLVQDLEPFGVAPVGASSDSASGGYVIEFYQQQQEVNSMSGEQQQPQEQPQDVAMSAEDRALLDGVRGLGLSVTDVQAMVAERDSVRQKARDLEITQVVRALEGVEAHDGVVQVEGTRHWPVVCEAVETALREQPQALALSADDDGRTGVDAVVLAVVNALPKEARMALSAQPSGTRTRDDPPAGESAGPTDEQIDALAARV